MPETPQLLEARGWAGKVQSRWGSVLPTPVLPSPSSPSPPSSSEPTPKVPLSPGPGSAQASQRRRRPAGFPSWEGEMERGSGGDGQGLRATSAAPRPCAWPHSSTRPTLLPHVRRPIPIHVAEVHVLKLDPPGLQAQVTSVHCVLHLWRVRRVLTASPSPEQDHRAREDGTYLLLLVEELEHVLHVHKAVLDHPGRERRPEGRVWGAHPDPGAHGEGYPRHPHSSQRYL